MKPWFRDGPETSVSDDISAETQRKFEEDIALVHTDDPYYDERFTEKELDEINRIRVMDREGKLDHVEKLDRVRDWIDVLESDNHISQDVADIYDIRLDHADYLYDEATADGNLDSKKPVSFLRRTTSTVLDFVPFVGNAKAAYEAIVGVDPITGEELSALDRTVSAGGVIFPWIKGIKKGVKIVKGVAKYGDEGADLVGLIGQAKKSRNVVKGVKYFDDLALKATRNPDSTKVVLGKTLQDGKAYTKVAAHYKATYFKLDNWRDLTKTLSRDEIWDVNKAFLKQQVKAGKQIILSHDPSKASGFFSREVAYLEDLGYHFVKDGWVWKAVR